MSAPPATLLLLAYNQKDYVADGVRAALAQDYPNLQIVVSDDCSPDRTFAVIENTVAGYAGPHRIVLNRTPINRGILAHVYDAVAHATGDLIVLGAADDISYPQRVSRLVSAWQATGADGLFSGYDMMDDGGRVIATGCAFPNTKKHRFRWFAGQSARIVHGAMSAYSRAMFDAVPLPPTKIMFEDTFFANMLYLRSRIVTYVPEPLVLYRKHSGALTNALYEVRGLGALAEREGKSARLAQFQVDVLSYVRDVAHTGLGAIPDWGRASAMDMGELDGEIDFLRFRARWLDTRLADRIAALTRVRTRQHLAWLLPRLAGVRGLALAKRARRALRGIA